MFLLFFVPVYSGIVPDTMFMTLEIDSLKVPDVPRHQKNLHVSLIPHLIWVYLFFNAFSFKSAIGLRRVKHERTVFQQQRSGCFPSWLHLKTSKNLETLFWHQRRRDTYTTMKRSFASITGSRRLKTKAYQPF